MRSMELDWRICSRARLARDARFDGKFFIGCLTTKIYCRPICRSRTSRESNVRYFASAAAAAQAGFRPCLRCRPECSPGTRVWSGTRNTVSRALQLIMENGLEDGGVEGLAERLGIGSRHLRRLFLRHLGATPSAVAQNLRLQFAKKLIDETRLPMSQIAFASGFGCVRRFNHTIRNIYHRTPTQIRRLAPQMAVHGENEYVFRLHFRPPYNWRRMLEFLGACATPGVEAVLPGRYVRAIALEGNRGHFEISLDAENHAITARVHFPEPRLLFHIVERIRGMFDLDADWSVIAETLRKDPLLAPLVRAEAGLRVPGCWNGFELASVAILSGGRTTKAAAGLVRRVVETFGRPWSVGNHLMHIFPPPEVLAEVNLERAGVAALIAETIGMLARAACERSIPFERVTDTRAILQSVSERPDVSDWVQQYVALRALRDPDAFPASDRTLCRTLSVWSADELEMRSRLWRPWRAYAAVLLWQTAEQRQSFRYATLPESSDALFSQI
jgi:AraC family transcriptional regulator, regulatory protein of adaptative response / DNA-3-methyladenine glycosylase II